MQASFVAYLASCLPFERRAKSLPCSVEEVSGYREGSILCGVFAITAQIGYNNLSGELNRVSRPYCIIRIMTLVTFALCNMVQHPVGWKKNQQVPSRSYTSKEVI